MLPDISAEPDCGVGTEAQLTNYMISRAQLRPDVNWVELICFIFWKSLLLKRLARRWRLLTRQRSVLTCVPEKRQRLRVAFSGV